MREGFSVSATMEALQFLIPCTFCDELVVKGDDGPSWRGSRRGVQHLAHQHDKKSAYSEMADSHMKRRKRIIKTTIKRPRTEQLLLLHVFFFFAG